VRDHGAVAGDLLLLSNSRPPGGAAPFAHARAQLDAHLGDRELWFVPYARADHDDYTAWVAHALGREVRGVHRAPDPVAALHAARAVMVGGGNTFRLLATVRRLGLLEPLRTVERYVGSSAGTNLAGPTIRTTNDMPIVEPAGLDALGLVPFQINPHYLDPDPTSSHQGETREERIAEFHEENATPVLGLREGAWLHRGDGTLTLGGNTARLFRRAREPLELAPGADLAWLTA
jgi:dipeptidase E